jgi:hypothetical protein
MLYQRPLSAVSRPVLVMQPNDSTEATLPDAKIQHRSRPGPFLPANDLDRGGSLIAKN